MRSSPDEKAIFGVILEIWCGRLGGKVTLKPPERKESVINVSTRLLGDLARAWYGLDEVVWVYELPLLLLPTIHPLI